MKVSGPGVEKTGVQPGKPTWFTINASEAGKGDVQVKVEPVGKSLSLCLFEDGSQQGVGEGGSNLLRFCLDYFISKK